MATTGMQMDRLFLAMSFYRRRKFEECAEVCTQLLHKNPYDQASWCLKTRALTEQVYVDEVDVDEEGIAEMLMDDNAVAQLPRNVMWKDKVTNESVLTKLKTKRQLLSDIQKRKLKYFGHIKIKNNTLTTVLEGKLEGKRPRGPPWNNWMVDIKEWTYLPAYTCTSQAADCNLWSVNARQPSEVMTFPDTRNGTFWNRSAYHLSSYNCSVN